MLSVGVTSTACEDSSKRTPCVSAHAVPLRALKTISSPVVTSYVARIVETS